MKRRDFLRLTGAAAAGAALPDSSRALAEASASGTGAASPPSPGWKTYELTTRVEVLRPEGVTRVWLPTPLTQDTPWQRTFGNAWRADGGIAAQWIDATWGAGVVWAEFPSGVRPVLELTSRFATRDAAVDFSRPGGARAESAATLARYTAPTELLPTDGIVRETAARVVKGARTDLERARALYEWVVESTYRDPNTRGCGLGDVRFMLEHHAMGGKCADLNALFVALARSEGIPARDVYGVRVGPSALGFATLGRAGGDVTKAQHCRAEFWLPTHGWIPVDPADVRKVILEEGGGRSPDDPMVLAVRRRLFGSWEMNWAAFNTGHDLSLPRATNGKLPFLMYPQAESGGTPRDALDPEGFRYSLAARELGA